MDLIFGKYHPNQTSTAIDLHALKFNGFLNYTFYKIQSNNNYNLDWCQIRISTHSRGFGLIMKSHTWC